MEKKYIVLKHNANFSDVVKGELLVMESDDGSNMPLYKPLATGQTWYIKDEYIEEVEANENDSHALLLVSATFRDTEGRKVRVKRSKCRHYYVKVDGSKQERVHLDDIKRVIAAY